jgi:hypothetical protein
VFNGVLLKDMHDYNNSKVSCTLMLSTAKHPSDDGLQMVLKECPLWATLAVRLGVPIRQVKALESQTMGNLMALGQWRDANAKDYPATWEFLLQQIGNEYGSVVAKKVKAQAERENKMSMEMNVQEEEGIPREEEKKIKGSTYVKVHKWRDCENAVVLAERKPQDRPTELFTAFFMKDQAGKVFFTTCFHNLCNEGEDDSARQKLTPNDFSQRLKECTCHPFYTRSNDSLTDVVMFEGKDILSGSDSEEPILKLVCIPVTHAISQMAI